eukprot:TRINITY_DN35361_c0_g1_i1.p1 TRINITY_DN35361_c0_g1~~TRINITY_DN35361_c0_g1_i1.p1  ORF type:complete len:155 (+),score=13.22 TRINITY_DN35361_c0_g1_i1:68-532(+)
MDDPNRSPFSFISFRKTPDATPLTPDTEKKLEATFQKLQSGQHINILMGRHPFHPYDPNLPPSHPCTEANETFRRCFETETTEDMELHMRHVACYTKKVPLMICLTEQRRKERQRLEREAEEEIARRRAAIRQRREAAAAARSAAEPSEGANAS